MREREGERDGVRTKNNVKNKYVWQMNAVERKQEGKRPMEKKDNSQRSAEDRGGRKQKTVFANRELKI